jgi:cysteine synthase A
MPESMSSERQSLLRALGATLELTPAVEGMRAAIDRAEQLVATMPRSWMPRQSGNRANPAVHEQRTGPEIWADTDGRVDIVVAGVGTGGTITGVTRCLRRQSPDVQAIAIESATSAVVSGNPPGLHEIQGIGAGFVPKNLDRSLLTAVEIVTFACSSAERYLSTRLVPTACSAAPPQTVQRGSPP